MENMETVEMKPSVTLVGQDGNAFVILGLCKQAMRKAKWDAVRIAAVMHELQSGDYDHLLQTAMRHFDVN